MNTCGILERQAVIGSPETPHCADEVRELQTILAERVKHKTGNTLLWDTLHGPRLIAELRATLQALDIQPFSPASVKEYKKKIKKRLNRKANFVLLIGLSLCLFGIPLMIDALGNISRWPIEYIAGGIVAATGVRLIISSSMRWNWQWVRLSDYRKPIPEFVLETACRVSDRMPEATLWIAELARNREAKDPFLAVQAGTTDTVQETHYVEVFEEPRFERV